MGLTANTISNTLTILQLVQELGAVPILAPLKPACAIAIQILQKADDVRRLRKDHAGLARRAGHLLLVMRDHGDAGLMRRHDPELQRNMDRLLVTLQEINDHMEAEISRKLTKRLLKTRELQEKLLDYNIELDECQKLFIMSSVTVIQRRLADPPVSRPELADAVNRINTKIEDTAEQSQKYFRLFIKHLETASTTLLTTDYPVLRYEQLEFEACLPRSREQPSSIDLYRGLLKLESGSVRVVVKRYSPVPQAQEAFVRDVKFWQHLHHPYLHRVIGHSSLNSVSPFVVLSDYSCDNVCEFLDEHLSQGEVVSFMATLNVIEGIASAVEFLLRCCSLTKEELEECMKIPNLMLTVNKRIIVGHNLVVHRSKALGSPLPVRLDEWLKQTFWYLIATFVFANRDVDYSVWTSATARGKDRSASHLRFLPSFSCYLMPTFLDVARELGTLKEKLDGPFTRGTLTFPDIRRSVLALEPVDYIYRPRTPIDVEVGDIGFMGEDRFIVICNVRHQFQYVTPTPLTLTCSGSYETGSPDGSGIIRHKYNRASVATVRRQDESVLVGDYKAAWDFLILNASRIRESNLKKHPGLCLRDIILVIGTQNDLRYSTLNWKAGDNDNGTPLDVEFVEYEDVSPSRPWGYWVVPDGSAVSITHHRIPQEIVYLQLEDSDDLHPFNDSLRSSSSVSVSVSWINLPALIGFVVFLVYLFCLQSVDIPRLLYSTSQKTISLVQL